MVDYLGSRNPFGGESLLGRSGSQEAALWHGEKESAWNWSRRADKEHGRSSFSLLRVLK
jgi:hypothetical protein